MNSLGRDIEENEVVILKENIFKKEYKDLSFRRALVFGGFGTKAELTGSALFCIHVVDGERCRYEGFQIDKEETLKYQSENGKFLSQERLEELKGK